MVAHHISQWVSLRCLLRSLFQCVRVSFFHVWTSTKDETGCRMVVHHSSRWVPSEMSFEVPFSMRTSLYWMCTGSLLVRVKHLNTCAEWIQNNTRNEWMQTNKFTRLVLQPIANRVALNLEIIFKLFSNEPEFCPWDLWLVPSNKCTKLNKN